MKKNIHIGRFIGIDVYLHYSWFFIFALLSWALAKGFFPMKFPGHELTTYWVLGLLSSLLLFVSVLLHEFSHSIIAKKHNIRVDRITLFFFGGMAGLHEKKMEPKTEFQMAIAGPVCSLFLAGVFLVIYNIAPVFFIGAIASYLYRINLILAIFNLVPGFPLDGGRVLRSIVWYWTNDFKKATRIATTGGKFVAYFLIGLGIATMFTASFGGFWFILIGFFLLLLSTLSYEQVLIKDALAKMKAKDFLMKRFIALDPDMPARDAAVKYFFVKQDEAYPVIKHKKLVGVIMFDNIQLIKKNEWKDKKVKDLMIHASKISKVNSTTKAYTALVKMLKSGLIFLPVVKDGKLLGIIRRNDMLRYVKIKSAREKFERLAVGGK